MLESDSTLELAEGFELDELLDDESGFTADGQQFLTFTLQGEDYGIDILRVQEIRGYTKVRPIPNAPHHVRGVINLRGAVVPVIDLRARFGLEHVDYDEFTVIIVVMIGTKVIGLIVDAVSDVLNISESQIDETPELTGEVDTSFFAGLGRVGKKLILLLELERLIEQELLTFDSV